MMRLLAVVVGADDVGRDAVTLEGVAVELMADEGEGGFFKAHGAVGFLHRRQAGLGEFVAVASGVAAEIGEIFATAFREEADGVVVALFQIAEGVAAWFHIHRRDLATGAAWRPDGAEAAPADGHGVVVVRRADSEQRPVVVEEFENLCVQIFDFFHTMITS